jgi:tRNA-(ms[2]io[6]A)-hydroxylase
LTRYDLATSSRPDWVQAVLADFDQFLFDHAANERKASAMAMTLVAHYPDKPEFVESMIDLAMEELAHFRQVIHLIHRRGMTPPGDVKDPYVNALRRHLRPDPADYFLDRLLSAGIIEARGAERFALIANAVEDTELARFYDALATSEQNHHAHFIHQALTYFDRDVVDARFGEWAVIERDVLENLTIRARLH